MDQKCLRQEIERTFDEVRSSLETDLQNREKEVAQLEALQRSQKEQIQHQKDRIFELERTIKAREEDLACTMAKTEDLEI